MPVIEVDGVDAEPLEARLAAAPHVPRAAVNAEEGAVAAAHVAKLGGEDDLLPAVADGAASFVPTPYMSAVSRKSMPSSMALWIVAIDSSSLPPR